MLEWLFGQYHFLVEISLFLPFVGDGLQKIQRSCVSQVEVQSLNDSSFHVLKFLESVRVVGNIDVVVHFWWVNLLVFAGNPETSNTHKLVLLLADFILWREDVEILESQMQSLVAELERFMDFDEPVNKNKSHILGYVFENLSLLDFLR